MAGKRHKDVMGTFTVRLYGVPVQISGKGYLCIRRFIKFQNRAVKHARKLAAALDEATAAAQEANRCFHLMDYPIQEEEPPKKTAPGDV